MARGKNNRNGDEPGWVKDMRNDQIELKHAIKLFIEEAMEDWKQAAEDRKQAAEDRKQAAEDRKQFNAKIERYHKEAEQDRKDIKLYFSKIMEEIHMGRIEAKKDRRLIAGLIRNFSIKQDTMLGLQRQMISLQKDGNKKLGEISKSLRLRGNGNYNGRKRK